MEWNGIELVLRILEPFPSKIVPQDSRVIARRKLKLWKPNTNSFKRNFCWPGSWEMYRWLVQPPRIQPAPVTVPCALEMAMSMFSFVTGTSLGPTGRPVPLVDGFNLPKKKDDLHSRHGSLWKSLKAILASTQFTTFAWMSSPKFGKLMYTVS